MTREAIEKLNDKQIKYCKTMSVLINRDRNTGAENQYERDCGTLRGFLECLKQMGAINEIELKSLYLWFFTEDRS